MEFKKVHPLELVERILLLEAIRKVNPRDLRAFAPDVVDSIEEVDEETNKPTFVLVVNWEKLLFDAPIITLQKIMSNFVPIEKKSSGIIIE